MQQKMFHIGDILPITTGRLVSPRLIEGVYDILNFMTQDDLYTHQLPRASEECKPYLFKQMPWLSEIDASNVNQDNWEEWLKKIVAKYGGMHPVEPIPAEKHAEINPITELVNMMKKK